MKKAAALKTKKTNQNGNGNSSGKREKLFSELKERLIQERQILIDEAVKNQAMSNVQGYVAHGDIADLGNDLVNNEMLRGFAEHERQRIREIDEALARMDSGTYGICEISGEEINDARLIAMPTAKYTVEVQSRLEGQR